MKNLKIQKFNVICIFRFSVAKVVSYCRHLMEVAHISELRRKFEEAKNNKKAAQQNGVVAPLSELREKFEEAARKENLHSKRARQEENQSSYDAFSVDEIEVESDQSLKVRIILEFVW